MRITNVDVAAIVMGRKGVDSWGLWRDKAILCLLQVLLVNLCEGTFLLSVSVCVDGTCWHRLATNIFWVSWCPTDQQTLWERTCAIFPSWGHRQGPTCLINWRNMPQCLLNKQYTLVGIPCSCLNSNGRQENDFCSSLWSCGLGWSRART